MIIIGKYHNIRLFSGRLILMIFVGIDIAELNHFTSAISYNKGVIIEPFSFTNYSDGLLCCFPSFLTLKKTVSSPVLSQWTHYGNMFLRYLVEPSCNVYVINPPDFLFT